MAPGLRLSLKAFRRSYGPLGVLELLFCAGTAALIWALTLAENHHDGGLIAGVVVCGLAALFGVFLACSLGAPQAIALLVYNILSTLWCLVRWLVPYQWAIWLLLNYGNCSNPCETTCRTSLERLCGRCQRIINVSPLLNGGLWPFVPSDEIYRHYSWQELQSVASNCRLCDVLATSAIAKTLQFNSEQRPSADTLLYLHIVKTRSRHAGTSVEMSLQDGHRSCSDFFSVTPGHATHHRCDSAHTTDSAIAIDLAKTWIDRCRKHPICQPDPNDVEFCPTRLIDVGNKTSSMIQLVENPVTPLEYLALSHCWGKCPMRKRLLQADLEAMKLGISLSSLSQNFQNAISITREIGIRYIWIDSLCIIQDSTDGADWNREAGTMGQVYANALCVISATASAESEDGCFGRRVNPKLPSRECVLRPGSGKQNRGCHSVHLDGRSFLTELFDQFVHAAPLSSRAWAFQERILAKRIIHYCNGVVLFECNTLQASEYNVEGDFHQPKPKVYNDGTLRMENWDDMMIMGTIRTKTRTYPGLIANPSYVPPRKRMAAIQKTSARGGLRGEFQLLLSSLTDAENLLVNTALHNAWYEIVERYSMRNLTHDSDRLVAITGTANLIASSTGRTFISGLWLETLALNLLWRIKSSPPQQRLCISAPTWSWVSVAGGVKTGLDAFNIPDDPDIATLVSDVSIPITVAANGSSASYAPLTLVQEYALRGTNPNGAFVPDIPGISSNDERLLYLPIAYLCLGCKSSDNYFGRYHQQIHGIVLCPKAGTGAVVEYERVAYFWAGESTPSGVPSTSQWLRHCRVKRKIVIV